MDVVIYVLYTVYDVVHFYIISNIINMNVFRSAACYSIIKINLKLCVMIPLRDNLFLEGYFLIF